MTDRELLEAIYQDTQNFKKRIANIEMTLENETNRNIQVIAGRNDKLLLAISKILDEKLDEKFSPIGQSLNRINEQIKDIKLSLENIDKSI